MASNIETPEFKETDGILIEDQNSNPNKRGSGKRRLITLEFKCK